jgi:hypothetical protein
MTVAPRGNTAPDSILDAPSSALDRPLTITKFPDPKAARLTELTRSLREAAPRLVAATAATKGQLPLLKLAEFGGILSTKKSLRHNANVIAIEGVEGDHDAGTLTLEEAAERLRKAGLAAVLYTSPSHLPDSPRWRVLCPTSRPLPPAEREALCARLNGVLDGALAPESFTLSQSYYYGGVAGTARPELELVDGMALDLAAGLDGAARGRDGRPYRAVPEPAGELEDDGLGGLRPEPDLDRIGRALALIPSDDRETWLTVAMALHDEFTAGEEGFALWDEWSASSAKYDADDQRRVWESFGSRIGKPVTIGTLYKLAKQHAPPIGTGGLTFRTPAECEASPRRGYIIKGLAAPGDVLCVFGAPGAGKSLIAPYLGYMLALGLPAFGMRTKPGRVMYVAAEDELGMRGRLTALKRRHGDAPEFALVEGVSDLLDDMGPDLDALAAAVAEQRPALIVIDTLAMAFPGLEENDARDMGRVVAIARSLTVHGAAVMLIHHGTKAEGSTPRGHSVLNGALDAALQLQPADDGVVRGRLTKNKNGTCDRDIAFHIQAETLGTDEDGDAITAALAVELAPGSAPRRERLPASERAALAILTDMAGTMREPVDEAAWREACIASRRLSGSEERANQRRAVDRVAKGLSQKGLIALADGMVGIAGTCAETGSDYDDE